MLYSRNALTNVCWKTSNQPSNCRKYIFLSKFLKNYANDGDRKIVRKCTLCDFPPPHFRATKIPGYPEENNAYFSYLICRNDFEFQAVEA